MLQQKMIGLLFLLAASIAAAEDAYDDNRRLTLVFGPYVFHYNNDSMHNDLPLLTGLEWGPKDWPVDLGAVYFRNSFYQDSVYAYLGKRWFPLNEDRQGLYLKLTGGPLWGYRGQYEDKVPFNHKGLGVAVIPGIGYQYRAVDAQLVILGGAALMVTFGFDFWR